jgi:EAL domain-containing protein (putative c-di-GMP-specific phosphodiesterase class I)
MGSLGDWVLREACHQAQKWQSIDPARAFSVAVNLSAPEMFSADLIGRVRRALEESGLPGKLLVLEITERIMMADKEQATRQLGELRKLGVRIAIDDFGTGYSSLAYVRDLPVDILKIDRNFISPLGSDHQALALVRAIVGIANALDLDVIVEGAETAAQIELLGDLGCQVIQGFYFGRPTSADELENRLMRSRVSSIGT